jgi:hypothetical protein
MEYSIICQPSHTLVTKILRVFIILPTTFSTECVQYQVKTHIVFVKSTQTDGVRGSVVG